MRITMNRQWRAGLVAIGMFAAIGLEGCADPRVEQIMDTMFDKALDAVTHKPPPPQQDSGRQGQQPPLSQYPPPTDQPYPPSGSQPPTGAPPPPPPVVGMPPPPPPRQQPPPPLPVASTQPQTPTLILPQIRDHRTFQRPIIKKLSPQ